MQNMIPNRKEKGFTLIEMVMVIVILGILAAFALPKFADLGEDATKATLEAAKGSLKSANAMAHSSCLAADNDDCDVNKEASGNVSFEGEEVSMVYGYISGEESHVEVAADLSDYTVVYTDSSDNNQAVVQDADQTCGFIYTDTAGGGENEDDLVHYSEIKCGDDMPSG